ncbi:MAG: polysaccharide deacetylase family protein [Candidatus Bathyarchaeota archaeon]|nr:polysaccharide deacetylase family protein [Candidatus Bathyarchaeota archaeon]MDH5595115.1 polysaccharide deacetylase family protein [Candidatus Bathyarchaeota archaeon]
MKRNKLIVTTSWDDTSRIDLKLCELLENYRIKATFYAISNWIGKKISADELRHISGGHEVGAHTLSHAMLTCVGKEVAKEEILGSKTSLERILGKRVTSFAYPYGAYRREHVEIVGEAGFLCARTTKLYFTKIENPFETNITMLAAPHGVRDFEGLTRLFRQTPKTIFKLYALKKWNKLGKMMFDSFLKRGGVFHIFGHAWVIDQYKSWARLEDLLAYIAFRNNLKYLTVTDCVKKSQENGDRGVKNAT